MAERWDCFLPQRHLAHPDRYPHNHRHSFPRCLFSWRPPCLSFLFVLVGPLLSRGPPQAPFSLHACCFPHTQGLGQFCLPHEDSHFTEEEAGPAGLVRRDGGGRRPGETGVVVRGIRPCPPQRGTSLTGRGSRLPSPQSSQ